MACLSLSNVTSINRSHHRKSKEMLGTNYVLKPMFYNQVITLDEDVKCCPERLHIHPKNQKIMIPHSLP